MAGYLDAKSWPLADRGGYRSVHAAARLDREAKGD